MKKILLATIAAIAITACQPSTDTAKNNPQKIFVDGIKLVETKAVKKGEIAIPYKKYQLDNGLTVILAPDHSDPLVHVDITYHVGSAREEMGRSGFAHFFEHMMFQGSENVADEQHFKLVSESGGTLNGTTNSDRTNYYQTVPSNQLERVLWLEADRMGFLLPAVTEKKFENQRETVKNERGQNYDNRPYGLLWEKVSEALYPKGHPYSWTTIGYIEDLNRANLDDLKRFFLRWYGPNNAVLTIGGDIDEAQTLKWVKKYFGSIPRGPEVKKPEYTPVTLDKDRYISYEDNIALPLIYMSWPTVRAYDKDEAALDVLMSILGDGKTSLLYKNLVKPGKAVQASAGHGCRELSCQFTMVALPTPGNSLADLEKIMRQSLEEFEKNGANDDDLARVKAGIISGKIYGLESVAGKVSQLAAYETFRGDADYIGKDIARYENVRKEDVMRVYNKYIKNKPAVILSIVPKGKPEMVAKADTWKMYERNIPEIKDEGELELRIAKDDFDRSVIPSPGANPQIKVPEIYRSELENGIKVLGALNSEVPTTTIRLRLKAGQIYEGLDKLGLASLTAGMLDEATLKNSAEDIANELAKLGSSVSFSASDEYVTLFIRSLTKNLDKTIAIAAEKLMQPKFADDDFKRIKKQTIEGIKHSKKNASYMANSVQNLLLYGKNNSFAWPDSGTIASVEKITLSDVKNFYTNNFGAEGADIIAVSDLGQSKLLQALKPFAEFKGKVSVAKKLASFPKLQAGTIYFIDKDNAPQSEIRITKHALAYDATGEFYRAGIMNYPLGGAFNSRINLNLREDKGYTYGAFSFFDGRSPYQEFTAQAGVRSDTTTASIKEFYKEIKNFHDNGITEAELAFTKSARGQADARKYETPRQKLGFLSRIAKYNLDPDFVDEQAEILKNISKAEIDALAKKHLRLEDMITIIVGDKDKVLANIKTLKQPVIMLDTEANNVK